KDAEDNGLVIGREDRALGIDVSLQPFVNIDRDLEFGRGYNTFGEDPFLSGEIAAAQIKGIQSQHVMAQVKHFVAYDSNSGNIWVDDQTLHDEIGFKGFVTSDWGAVHAVGFINAGLDMEMPGEPSKEPGAFSIPSFFDSLPFPAPRPAVTDDTLDSMFGSHLPEEPVRE